MTRRVTLRAAAATVALITATSFAQANPYFVESDFPTVSQFKLADEGRTSNSTAVINGNNVSSTLNGVENGGPINVFTTGFKVSQTTVTTGTAITDRFIAWCLDTLRRLDLGTGPTDTTYLVNNSNPFVTGPQLSSGQRSDLKRLFDVAYDDVLSNLSANSGGFQLAAWEIVNETSGTYNISGGDFFASTGERTKAQSYLNLLSNNGSTIGNGGLGYRLVFLETVSGLPSGGQNLVTVAPVPLPAAGVLLLTALGGVAAAYRRKQRKAV
jgi:hypothetical protein